MKIRFLLIYNKAWWALLSPIIRWVEGTKFSHCALELNGIVFESTWPVSRAISVDHYFTHYKLVRVVELDIPQGKLNESSKIISSTLGKKYSFAQLVWILIDKISHKFCINMHLKYNLNSRLICSELMAMYLQNVFDVKFTKPLDLVGLVDITEALNELEKRQI
jgi:hypothetical protein